MTALDAPAHEEAAHEQAAHEQAAHEQATAALLGMHLDQVEPGHTVFSMLADELHENPMGTMHGGIIATFVDTAMGCALSSQLAATTPTATSTRTPHLRA